jgi:hypothetical protein
MRTRITGAAVLFLTVVGPGQVWARAAQPQQPLEAADSQQSSKPTPDELGISLERVKFALEQVQPPPLKIALDPPTFRVRIIEKYRGVLPDFMDTLKFPWEPIPKGGLAAYEFMNMVTPPQARPYGAFNSGELAQVAATSLVSALIMYGLKQGGSYLHDRYRDRVEAQIREEVKRELEEFLLQHPEAPRPSWWTGAIR